jgi:hypothetical protein
LAAELEPKPDVPARIRKLPQSQAPLTAASNNAVTGTQEQVASAILSTASAPQELPTSSTTGAFTFESPREKPAVCLPLGPRRYRLQLTATQEMHDTLEQLQHLLRHQVPDGDLSIIVKQALDVYLAQTLKQRFAQTSGRKSRSKEQKPTTVPCASEPSSIQQPTAAGPVCVATGVAVAVAPADARNTRTIPRAVLREVYTRDAGQCAFVAANGRRCSERGRLEVHHIVAFARGGEATVENLKLVCRSHNQWHAEQDFGRDFMRRKCEQAHQPGLSANRDL